mmetsp:Transcript_13133/g.37780  ORF Transcript_13133/g.37780 Transcript_13133/m.37780 type:complete len:198 (+) Transcript_13133:46-639(+)
MSSADRVDKYHSDGAALLGSKPLKADKVRAEIRSLRKWLQKHQDETLAAGPQGKLLETAQAYHKAAAAGGPDGEALQDEVLGLVEDLLKLPEGKLVSSKAKRTAIKWTETLRGKAAGSDDAPDAAAGVAGEVMDVIDIAGDGAVSVTLMDEDGETLEGVAIDDEELAERLRSCFDAGDATRVSVDRKAKRVLGLAAS